MSKRLILAHRPRPILGLQLLATAVAVLCALAPVADAGPLGYGGRITKANGQPVAGVIDVEVRFFDQVTNGVQLGSTLQIDDVTLTHGVFQIDLALLPADVAAVFGTRRSGLYPD